MKLSSLLEMVNLHEKEEIWTFTGEDLQQKKIHFQRDLRQHLCMSIMLRLSIYF